MARQTRRLLGVGIAIWGGGLGVLAAAERFPFVIPGDDASPTATDLSALNEGPAGGAGFVRIRAGHFATDQGRIRFWGVNTCFGANFPSHDIAERAAAHLAKLGINAVRMHHHDTAAAPRGILGPVRNGRRALDPVQLERQDYFLDQLHRHGIYANLNLHVGRALSEAEGHPDGDLPRAVRYDKYLLYYMPAPRAALKDFCRAYLTHRNPYRRLRRVDDPGIAMIEITNENAFSSKGPGIAASLPEPYRGEFKRQWNAWLKRRYGTTTALRAAWHDTSEPLRAVLPVAPDWARALGPWRLHNTRRDPYRVHLNQPGPRAGVPGLGIEIPTASGQVFEHELQLPDLPLEAGQLYTLSFWVRADAPRPLHADVSRQGPDSWGSLGYQETLTLPTTWTRIVRTFRATATAPGRARICFKFGGQAVDFALAGVTLQRGGRFTVIPAGQSVEAGTVEIPDGTWVDDAQADALRFMRATEIAFIRDMVHFLKEDLGVRVPITASQITYHDPDIVARTCDYVDIHAYWQHPRFPGRPWDRENWFIENTPMEAAPRDDRLLSRAPWRLLDRPFTISEWNIPSPSDYAAGTVPFAALVAGIQDWDGVFFFQYHSSGEDWFDNGLRGYFSFNGHPVKLSLLTACAPWFRRGDLRPPERVLAGTVTERLGSSLGLDARIGIDPRRSRPDAAPPVARPRLGSTRGPALWDATEPNRAFVRVNTPKTRAVWGLTAGRRFDLGSLRLEVGPTERDYAAVVVTSLDDRPLEASRSILLCAVGSAENAGMVWNAERRSVGSAWGRGPTRCNGIPLRLSLANRQLRRVHALDGTGQRDHAVAAAVRDGRLDVQVGPPDRTLWYLLTP